MNTRWHGIGNLIPLFMGLLWLVLAQTAFGDTVTITYHYDALGRLDSVDHGTGSRSSFTYDPAGNITQLSVAASGTDTTPNAYSFPQKTAMPLDTLITSAPVQITGINAPASWTTSGGWACVGTTNASNCGCADTAVASSGTINNGEYICARHFTPPSYSASTITTVTVGGVSAQFQTTTVDPGTDATPDPFSFTAKTGVALATTITSDRVQITGINRVTSWSVSGGTACASSLNTLNCGCTDNSYTTSGEMLNNEYICARHTSSSSYSTTTTTTVTVGGVSSSFQSSTLANPGGGGGSGMKIGFDSASLNALGATYSGSYQFITGRNGGAAIKFSGPNQPGHVRLPNRPEWQFTTGATFDLWARVDSATGMDGFGNTNSSNWAMALIAKSHDNTGFAISTNAPDPNSSGTGYGFAAFASMDSSWSGTGCQALKRNPGIPLNTWFRLTLTASSTGGVATYLNKELIYTCPNARPNFSVANQQDLYIGKFSDSWYPLNGAIQDLTIYQTALTATQVQALTDGSTPNAFSFAQKTAMPLSTMVTSAPVQITGTNAPSAWTVTNGWACVGTTNATNCGCSDVAFNSSGTINNGEYICARHTSSSSYSTTITSLVAVGGVSASFQSTTIAFSKLGQNISFGAAPSVIIGGTGTVSATGGASGNPVIFSSTTPLVCSTSGTNGSIVTGLTAGSCIIAANQSANANYNAAAQVTQTFSVTTGVALTVINSNKTFGTITSDVGGIACGATCSANFPYGAIVTLTATPASGEYQFTGWGGACSGGGKIFTLTMDAAKSCTGSFGVFNKKRRSSWKRWLLSQ
jgi:YD repeat-containing protein